MTKNLFTPETEEEINEMVTKNFLKSKNISYHKLGDHMEKVVGAEEDGQAPGGRSETATNASPLKQGESPVKV